MFWAMVPEAAIYENRNFLFWKNNIRFACKRCFQTISEAALPKSRTQSLLRISIAATYFGHIVAALFFCQNIRHAIIGLFTKKYFHKLFSGISKAKWWLNGFQRRSYFSLTVPIANSSAHASASSEWYISPYATVPFLPQ